MADDLEAAPGFGPYRFALSEAEARAAGARAGLRLALAGGLIGAHLAPLAAFVLALVFIATLALTGLVARRHGELALLVAAIAFMGQRALSRWRMRCARRDGSAAIEAMLAAGEICLTADRDGLTLASGKGERRLAYRDCREAEDAGGLVYVWARDGAPLVAPVRVFADQDAAGRFVGFVKSGIAGARR